MADQPNLEANAKLFEISERWAARYRPGHKIDLSQTRLPPPSYRGDNPYNGFTAAERILTDRVIIYLRRASLLPKPTVCELCGGTERIGYHGENYFDPFALIQVCFPCHMAIHRRFKSSEAWHRRLSANLLRAQKTGLNELPDKEPDFASWIRIAVPKILDPRKQSHLNPTRYLCRPASEIGRAKLL